MDVSIIICTANRAADLHDTLASLARVSRPGRVELLVVDNRSTDHTPGSSRKPPDISHFGSLPVRDEAGKYAALNAGIRASKGRVIVATDDDARFEPDWLERAVDGLSRYGCEFVGGRVDPIWGGQKPAWLLERNGLHANVIALLDHGDRVREFGCGISWPLGVNVAYRRDVFERVGLFDNRLGRKIGTLRNQAQREWHLRARAAGARGFYLPEMVVHHLVARDRLEKQYFRRWWYWHGISRAILFAQRGFDMEKPELERPPHAGDRQVGGVPLHLIRRPCVRRSAWCGRRSRETSLWRSNTSCGSVFLPASSASAGPTATSGRAGPASVKAIRAVADPGAQPATALVNGARRSRSA
jgi:glycosyltransferase involved in cell wall biosynthesis